MQSTGNSDPGSPSELERLERSMRIEFGPRQIAAWGIFLFGVLFSIMGTGCIIQHYVDRTMPWGRDPVRDVVEPSALFIMSALTIVASRLVGRQKYLLAAAMLIPFGAVIATVTLMFGF